MWSSYVQNSPISTIIQNVTFMLFVFETDQLDEDNLEDLWKRLLDEAETGLLRPYSWHDDDDWLIDWLIDWLKTVLILQVYVVSYPIRH